ncbi:MAG: hypothetical protein Greene041679_324 [Parcubacteria group bacterium Greene0416_79]|nr:MAG: hypothetical protein Greene041679_324 [Parcubacteria group bacterium Greene0416_79]
MRIKTALVLFSLFALLALVEAGGRAGSGEPPAGAPRLLIGGREIVVEVADTASKRLLGLSGRASLQSERGMLFVFPAPGFHGIWMKQMRFPIDIIWLQKMPKDLGILSPRFGVDTFRESTLLVADIKEEVTPETYPEVFYPRSPARYVLEVAAGFAEAHSLRIGEPVRVQYFE